MKWPADSRLVFSRCVKDHGRGRIPIPGTCRPDGFEPPASRALSSQPSERAMNKPRFDPDRLGDTFVATLLIHALKEVATAYARANKTAALLTIGAIERELMIRAEEFPTALASPRMPTRTRSRITTQIAAALGEVQRAAEEASLQ